MFGLDDRGGVLRVSNHLLLQLRDVLPKFASAHIREHLLYVLDNVPVDGGQQPRPERRTRDVRAQLYARIGVTNTVTSSTSHSEYCCYCVVVVKYIDLYKISDL